MTHYRLFSSTAGPSAPVSYSGNFISGLIFAVSGGGGWFEGYWFWVCNSGQSTAPVKCALWSSLPVGTGVVIPGSVVTSGALIAGQWNYIPLPQPIQLAPSHDPNQSNNGSGYVAAIGCNGNFPDTASFWGTGGPGVSGISSGPLFAYNGMVGGANSAPYNMPQGCFSTGGSDPSTTFPAAASGVDNFWVDVQISDTAPVGYSGTYRLWPNKWDSNQTTNSDDNVNYNVATEIDISAPVTLNFIHYYIPPGASSASGLATSAGVWNINTQAKVAGISSPVWTTESGGVPVIGASGQWVKAAFAPSTTLPIGKYRVAVFNANGTLGTPSSGWNAKDINTSYFILGVGSAGITWGPLTAPRFADAQPATYYPGTGTGSTNGQPVFAYSGTEVFPNVTTGNNPGQVYWVDLEVTPVTVAPLSISGTSIAASVSLGNISVISPPLSVSGISTSASISRGSIFVVSPPPIIITPPVAPIQKSNSALFMHGRMVTIKSRYVTGIDEYGNDVYGFKMLQVGPCSIQQSTSREAINFTDQVVTGIIVFLPWGTQIGYLDSMIVDGIEYEITGDPDLWVSPFSGHTAPIRVTGSLVKGASP